MKRRMNKRDKKKFKQRKKWKKKCKERNENIKWIVKIKETETEACGKEEIKGKEDEI